MRWWPRVALGAFVALGIAELAGFFVSSRRGPDFADWAALVGPVAEEQKQGELVVVAPSWAEPLARQALGDEVFPLRDVARPDVSRYRAALEISALGERAPELLGFRETGRREVGPFVIRRLENPSPATVVFDFVDGLGPTQADVRVTSPEAACLWNPNARVLAGGLGGHPTFPAARFECPGGPFFSIGPTVIADQDFRPRRCLFAHPPARGEVVTRFSGVPLGTVIRGHGGMYWILERERKGAPVALAVRVDGEEIGRWEHRDGEGWAAFEMPLGAHAGKKSATVEFFVSSKNHAHRHFCFEADTR
ncbi:MAG TPA: hypothetical protein VM694_28365 [Polyangium sp.]|nr:hypothetical protein [Polyangium sp.]